MTATRSRKEEDIYKKYRQAMKPNAGCQFCDLKGKKNEVVRIGKHFQIIENIFPYSLWDGLQVEDHLMIIPKKHTDNLSNLPKEAAVEYVSLISEYEEKGYNIYARPPVSIIKSVPHQHTHLIKTTGKPKHFVFLLKKPFIRITL